MNKLLLALFFLFFSRFIYAENFCFSINNSNRILMISADRSYLFYYPINKIINLKLKKIEVFDDGGESNKITFSESYYEIINRKKTGGIYIFMAQSGDINEASYYNSFSKSKIIFKRIFGANYQVRYISEKCY